MVNGFQLPVKPEVEVDDRDALELIGLSEERHGRPSSGQKPFENVN